MKFRKLLLSLAMQTALVVLLGGFAFEQSYAPFHEARHISEKERRGAKPTLATPAQDCSICAVQYTPSVGASRTVSAAYIALVQTCESGSARDRVPHSHWRMIDVRGPPAHLS